MKKTQSFLIFSTVIMALLFLYGYYTTQSDIYYELLLTWLTAWFAVLMLVIMEI